MAWIRTIGEAEATGQLKEIYEDVKRRRGLVSAAVAAMALRPEALAKLEAFRSSIIFGASSLGRRREDMIALVVSGINGCRY
ncbi:MAG: carboxymuconolactone decarboxylase family protein [Chloroflexi bacterium]|nr:carboxymuconolactone decarboxylase family protein [Chloroflexota bacterium]